MMSLQRNNNNKFQRKQYCCLFYSCSYVDIITKVFIFLFVICCCHCGCHHNHVLCTSPMKRYTTRQQPLSLNKSHIIHHPFLINQNQKFINDNVHVQHRHQYNNDNNNISVKLQQQHDYRHIRGGAQERQEPTLIQEDDSSSSSNVMIENDQENRKQTTTKSSILRHTPEQHQRQQQDDSNTIDTGNNNDNNQNQHSTFLKVRSMTNTNENENDLDSYYNKKQQLHSSKVTNNNKDNEKDPLTTIQSGTTVGATVRWMMFPFILRTIHTLWNIAIYGPTRSISSTTTPTSSTLLISLPTVYIYTLLGSSIGFYIYVYFISIGHALGIFIPVFITIIRYITYIQNYNHHLNNNNNALLLLLRISIPSLLHSIMILLWSIRLGTFLLWREYISWPALHIKIRQIQNISILQKFISWFLYSLFYTCLVVPSVFRFQSNLVYQQQQHLLIQSTSSMIPSLFRVVRPMITYIGIIIQIFGLVLETIADYQKSKYKKSITTKNSNYHNKDQEWCNVGVWKYSTHPNYVGEWFFWFGTILTAIPSTFIYPITTTNKWYIKICTTIIKCSVMIFGMYIVSLILYGSANKLDIKYQTKYNTNPAYIQFQSTIGLFGPKIWYNQLRKIIHQMKTNTNTTKATSTSTTPMISDELSNQQQSTEALLDSTLAATNEEDSMFR